MSPEAAGESPFVQSHVSQTRYIEALIGRYDFDDDIIEATRKDRQPRINIYRPTKPMAVLGVASKPGIELNLDACLADQVPILRRHGGGCAVVIDPGNVVISMVVPIGGIRGISQYFNWLSLLLLAGLAEIGVPNVRRSGLSDIVINNRKVAGACVWCSKDFLYYSATLLVEPRIDLIERYLKYPPKEPPYRKGRAHRDFVGSLNMEMPTRSPDKIARELRKVLTVDELKKLVANTQ
jgi:lipoate-protein ligase A